MSDPLISRVSPHDKAAERAVLACCLLSAAALDEASTRLVVRDFAHGATQAVWNAMLALRAAGTPVDVVTVHSELGKTPGSLELAGGPAGLTTLTEEIASPSNVTAYADRVVQTARKRALIVAGAEITQLGYEAGLTVEASIATAEAKLYGAIGRSPFRRAFAAEAVPRMLTHLRKVRAGEIPLGFTSGFAALDRITQGWKPGEYSTIGARTSMGKTTFALGVVARLCAGGVRCGIVSLEMSEQDLILNMTAAWAEVDGHGLRSATLSDAENVRVLDAAEAIAALPLVIDDSPSGPAATVVSRVRSMAVRGFAGRTTDPNRQGCEVVVLDYLQHVVVADDKRRAEEIASVSTQMKQLARETGVHVIAICQLNRGAEARSEHAPQLGDIRDSGQIEQDLDLALLLHRPNYYDPEADPRLTIIRVAKNRNGPTGTAHLDFRRDCMRFEDRTDPLPDPEPKKKRYGRGRKQPAGED